MCRSKKRTRVDIYTDILEVLKHRPEGALVMRVLGEVLYSGSLEADEDVLFAIAPKKVGLLPAEPA